MTEKMRARYQRDQKIVAKYRELRDKYPTSSDNLIFVEISKVYGITPAVVRLVCVKFNALKKKEPLC